MIDKNNQELLELRARSIEEQSNLQDREGEKAKDQAETQTVSQLIRRTKHVKHSKICLYCRRLENRALILFCIPYDTMESANSLRY